MKESRNMAARFSSSTSGHTATRGTLPHIQYWVVAVAMVCLIAGAARMTEVYGLRHSALLLIGAALGVVLYHARFGFTTAFRLFVTTGDGRGIRAQMLMLALASGLFAPILAFSDTVGGAVAPVSLSVFVGAFIFSIGMQLGGG